ncbi:hypothetical protein ACXYMO_13095 [Arenibacterium sp. CAU 1754]
MYLLILFGCFAFALGSIIYENLAFLERKINPSTYIFWQDGKLWKNPPLFSRLMSDPEGQLSTREVDKLDDVDIFVLLLKGPAEIQKVKFANALGLNVAEISKMDAASDKSMQSAGIHFRVHVIPFYVSRRQFVIMNAEYLRKNYRVECLDEMVYGQMISQRDQELWDRCKVT